MIISHVVSSFQLKENPSKMDCKIQKCLYSTKCNAPEMKCIFSGFTPGPPHLLWLLFHRLSFFLWCYAKGSSKFCPSIFCLSAVQCVCVCATVCTSASGVLTKAVTYDSTNKTSMSHRAFLFHFPPPTSTSVSK